MQGEAKCAEVRDGVASSSQSPHFCLTLPLLSRCAGFKQDEETGPGSQRASTSCCRFCPFVVIVVSPRVFLRSRREQQHCSQQCERVASEHLQRQ